MTVSLSFAEARLRRHIPDAPGRSAATRFEFTTAKTIEE